MEYFFRLRLRIRDKAGVEFGVHFHPEDSQEPIIQDYAVGKTIAILYAHQHVFLDMTVGVRVEVLSSVQVLDISCSEASGH